jgi:CRP/FNR family transcriptional regulator, anaerobic regulatory protein
MSMPISGSESAATSRYFGSEAVRSRGSSGVASFPHTAGCCNNCASRECCLGSRLTGLADNRTLGVKHRHTLNCREHLFHAGDVLEAIYVVKSGAVKLYLTAEDGSEQVVAFYMPGEVLGLDALGSGAHHSSAVVLERSSFCVIPLASLDRTPGCHQLLYKLLAMELTRDHHTIELITRKDAETKMANFLLDLSERFRARGFSASGFNLSMKRNEIGNHLGLAVETVSRILTRFQDEGLLSVKRRQVQIHDFNGLKRLAGHQAAP